MTEKENALHIFRHQPDVQWVPHAFGCFDLVVPTQIVRERPPFGENGLDWFGCRWIFDPATNGFVQDFSGGYIVTDVTRWREQVRFPDLDAVDWEGGRDCLLQNVNREERLLLFMVESGLFERLHALMGFEEAMIAMYEEPEAVDELLSAIADYKIKLIGKLAQWYQPDAYMHMDDYASQSSLLMSPEMFRAQIKPHGARIGAALREHGILYIHHSCGKMDRLTGDILDMGAVAVNALTPLNDVDAVMEEYADRLVVVGGINAAGILDYPGATEEDIRAETRRAIDKLGPYKNFIVGGFGCSRESEAIVGDEAGKYGRTFYQNH